MEYNDFNKITTDTVGSKFEEFWTQYLDPKFAANKIAKIALQFRVGFANKKKNIVISWSFLEIGVTTENLNSRLKILPSLIKGLTVPNLEREFSINIPSKYDKLWI